VDQAYQSDGSLDTDNEDNPVLIRQNYLNVYNAGVLAPYRAADYLAYLFDLPYSATNRSTYCGKHQIPENPEQLCRRRQLLVSRSKKSLSVLQPSSQFVRHAAWEWRRSPTVGASIKKVLPLSATLLYELFHVTQGGPKIASWDL